MDKKEVLSLLMEGCAKAGNVTLWARTHGMSNAYVSDVLRGRAEPGPKILAALGLERTITYKKGEGT